MLMLACGSPPDTTPCPTGNCANYKTQEQAQAAFDADKSCLDELDDDHDGKACEHLPSAGTGTNPSTGTNTGSNCPSTANCGCSGKNKSSCGGPCCKWVVGTGCVCN